MKDLKVTTEYKGHPVINGDYGEYRYNKRHLANNLELMERMTKRHNKVYSYRMDLRMPHGVKLDKTPKQVACNFMNAYCKKLARQKVDSEYIMKMEKDKGVGAEGAEHFHIQMFVDGGKRMDHGKLTAEGEKLLATQIGLPEDNNGLLDYTNQGNGKKNGIMIRRNSDKFEEQFDKCYKQMSYLAKQKPSDQVKSNERKVFYSKFRNGKSRRSK
jgi:hypothetical protein